MRSEPADVSGRLRCMVAVSSGQIRSPGRNPWSRLVGAIRTERSPQTSATGAYMPWTFVKSSPEPLTVQPSNRMSPVQPMKCVASAMVLKTRPDRSSATMSRPTIAMSCERMPKTPQLSVWWIVTCSMRVCRQSAISMPLVM